MPCYYVIYACRYEDAYVDSHYEGAMYTPYFTPMLRYAAWRDRCALMMLRRRHAYGIHAASLLFIAAFAAFACFSPFTFAPRQAMPLSSPLDMPYVTLSIFSDISPCCCRLRFRRDATMLMLSDADVFLRC